MIDIELQTTGNIWKVLVKVGEQVKAGQVLFILEVMKMEVEHETSCDGVVREVNILEGDEGLEAGMVAIVIDPS